MGPPDGLADGQARHEPGQHRSTHHDGTRHGVGGPFVTFAELAPMPAAEPGQQSFYPGCCRARLSKFVRAHEIPTPPVSSSLAGRRPTHRIEAAACGVLHNLTGTRPITHIATAADALWRRSRRTGPTRREIPATRA